MPGEGLASSRGTLSVHIAAPVEKVFDYFKDPANWQELTSEIEYHDVVVTDEGIGTTYRWDTRVAGIRLNGAGEFVEFVPNERIVDRSSRSFEGTWTYRFEPEGTGTRLIMSSESRSFWRLPPLSWLLAWTAGRSHRGALEAARSRLEEQRT